MITYYLKMAWRRLVNNKIHSVINLIGLSLGIFGSIVIFQFVKYHVSTDKYHSKHNDIYRVVMDLHLEEGVEHEKGSPYILHETLKNDFANIENIAYIGQQELTVSIVGEKALKYKFLEKESAAFVNEGYFKIFDYDWLSGNASAMNMPHTAVITEKYAKKFFGDKDPLNQIITINNKQDVRVAGLLKDIPGNTDLRTEVFISLPTMRSIMPDFGYDDWQWFSTSRETYVLLRKDVLKDAVEAQLPAFAAKYYGANAKYYQFHLQKFSDVHFNIDYNGKVKKSAIAFFSIVGVLLIVIACINFINLATAQSFKRFKEIGVRKTLGSTQPQLFWQFINEVFITAIIAIVTALLCAYMVIPVVNSWLGVQITFAQFFDLQTLFFGLLLIIFITLGAGLYPSLVIANYNSLEALKGVTGRGNKGALVRKPLVMVQFSCSFILIALSILIVKQSDFLRSKDIGSTKELILHVKLPDTENKKLGILKDQLLQKPDVEHVSFSNSAPSSHVGWGGSIKFDNRDWEKFVARSRSADENYLDTYQIRLVAGRKPVAADTINEILINEILVKKLGLKNNLEALGKQLIVGDADNKGGRIVGVVADFNNTDLYSSIEPTIIFSLNLRYRQAAIRLNSFDSRKTISEIRTIWEKIYPDNVFEYSFYDEELATFYKREELTKRLTSFFAFLSIFISCLGLLGLISLSIAQRIKEIGVRKVLGASVKDITVLVSKDFLKIIMLAIIIAAPIAYYLMYTWLQDFAYRVNIGWWIFMLAGASALFIALATISFQAIKAAMANPVKSLRTE